MFKNLTIYRLPEGWSIEAPALQEALQVHPFVACAASQEQSMGWVPPRGEEGGALVESINGQHILQFRIETKTVPGDAIRKKADEAAAHVEAQTGRKPGRKELRDLRDEAKRALLPTAFSKTVNVWVWLNLAQSTLAVDAGSQSRVDAVITALVNAMPSFAPRLVNTQTTPQSAMTAWLAAGEADGAFQIERDCELKATSEDRAAIKYKSASLDNDQVKNQIAQGMLPVKLSLNWQGRMGFALTEAMQIKNLQFLDTVFEGKSPTEGVDGFDADVAIATGELSNMLPELVDILGGELAAA